VAVTASTPSERGYQPALDGLRALAVTAVVLFHAGVAGFGGGYLGVDLFFVLSGYLITSLLLDEHARTGRIALGAFWLRRARRLLPALLLVLVAVAIAGRQLLDATDQALLRTDELAALGYVANWRMIWRGTGYFADTATPSPLQHTWSLGIEEQFYLLWPLVVLAVLALWVRRGRPALAVICGIGALASAVTTIALLRLAGLDRAYFGTESRAQALLLGAALAVGLARRRPSEPVAASRRWLPPITAAAGIVGLSITVALWWIANDPARVLSVGGLTLTAVAAALLIASVVISPVAPFSRVLSVGPMRWLGRLSYGIYLWHWPVAQFLDGGRTGLGGVRLLAVRLAVTLGIAVASYYLVEQPVRRGALRRLPRRLPVIAGASAYAATAVVVVLLVPPAPPVTAAGPAVIISVPATRIPSGGPGSSSAPIDRPGRRPGVEPRVTFLGDSVSWTIGAFLPDHPGLWVSNRAIQGCGIATLPEILLQGQGQTNYPGCTTWYARWRRAIDADDPDVAVILLNRWELADRRLNGQWRHVGQPDYDEYLLGQLDLAVRIAASRGAAVVLLTAAYTHRAERPGGGLYPEDDPARIDAWNRLLLAEKQARPEQVTILDLNSIACPDGAFTWRINGIRVRSDGLHFTAAADQRIIAPWLLPRLAAIATGSYQNE
jgi:peptidoglycan/LPS O-acetylase OafA/YrhL